MKYLLLLSMLVIDVFAAFFLIYATALTNNLTYLLLFALVVGNIYLIVSPEKI